MATSIAWIPVATRQPPVTGQRSRRRMAIERHPPPISYPAAAACWTRGKSGAPPVTGAPEETAPKWPRPGSGSRPHRRRCASVAVCGITGERYQAARRAASARW
jgi:hypothetical protein